MNTKKIIVKQNDGSRRGKRKMYISNPEKIKMQKMLISKQFFSQSKVQEQ